MTCPECSTLIDEGQRYCGHCGRPVVVRTGTLPIELLIALPYPIALLLKEYDAETHPYVKLHRICETAEMLTRFLVAMALAELTKEGDRWEYGPELQKALAGDEEAGTRGLQWPSFGDWLAIVQAASAVLARVSSPLVPELPSFVKRFLLLVKPERDCTPERAIYPLRNALAHDGRFSSEQARVYLDDRGHRQRFEALWTHPETAFLRDLELVGITAPKKSLLLRGAAERLEDCEPFPSPRLEHLRGGNKPWPSGTVLLTRPGQDRALRLFPLYAVGQVLQEEGGRLRPVTQNAATQVYARKNKSRLEYTALCRDFGHGVGTEEMRRTFEALFPFGAWRKEVEEAARLSREANERDNREASSLREAIKALSFRDVVEEIEAAPFVGREAEISSAVKWLDEHPSSRGVIFGQPGMGKSALAVRLFVELRKTRKKWLCLRYFFRTGDHRCSVRSFSTAVLLQLQQQGGQRIDLPAGELEVRERFVEALESFSRDHLGTGKGRERLVLLVDGIDEIAQVDRGLLLLVQSCRVENVAWLVLGCPDPVVATGLAEPDVARIYPVGLPPLSRRAVRECLMSELGWRLYEFLEDETDSGESDFLDALAEKSRALPLYLHLVLQDIRAGKFHLDRPGELPHSLESYYAQLIERCRLDSAAGALPFVIALLAVAHGPLTVQMLGDLLDNFPGRGDENWPDILRAVLELGHTLIRPDLLSGGQTGYTLYHESFREYLLQGETQSYGDFRMAPMLRDARKRIMLLCRRWREWPPDSAHRDYALRHYRRHLVGASAWDDLAALMTDLSFLEAKAEAGMAFDLLSDLEDAASHLPGDHPQRNVLELLSKAAGVDMTFISEHPTSLFQSLWNRCWWYDSPQAADHYEPDPEGVEPPPWRREGPKLFTLMERWEQERGSGGRPWLRSLRPPAMPLGRELQTCLRGHTGPVLGVAISENGSLLASASADRTVRLWSASSGRQMFCLEGHDNEITCVTLSLDGKLVASGSVDSTVRLWDATSGRLLRYFSGHEGTVRGVAFSPDGTLLASGGWDNTVQIWEVPTGDRRALLRRHTNFVEGIAFSPDGSRLATASRDRTIRLWDTGTWEELQCLEGHLASVMAVAFSRSGRRLASASHDHTVLVWDTVTGEVLTRLADANYVYIESLAFCPDDEHVASGSNDRTVRIWNIERAECVARLEGHGGGVTGLAFSRYPHCLVSGSWDATLMLWDLTPVQAPPRLRGEDPLLQEMFCLSYLADGQHVATPGVEAIRIWDAETGLNVFAARDDGLAAKWVAGCITSHTVSPRLLLAGGDFDGTVRVWDVSQIPPRSAQPLWRSTGHDGRMYCICFSPDGKILVAGGANGEVHLWDATNGSEVARCRGHKKQVYGIAFSADGQLLASSSADRTVRLWEGRTGASRGRCSIGHSLVWDSVLPSGDLDDRDGDVSGTWLLSVAVSPDGRWVAAGTDNDTVFGKRVYVWDLARRARRETDRRRPAADLLDPPRELKGHQAAVDSLLFSLDGRLIASGSADETVRIWDIVTGQCLYTLGARFAAPEHFAAAASGLGWQHHVQGRETQFKRGGAIHHEIWFPSVPRLVQKPGNELLWAGPDMPGTYIHFLKICGE